MKKILLALAALTLGSPALAAVENPPPLASNESIVDRADLLTDAQEVELESQIRTIYNQTNHHIVVLTMPTLDGQPVQDYINNAFRYYKIGNRARNDGVLLLVSMANPRRLQIEVGYGLEGVLTDARSKVITDSMVPLMKAGQPADAIKLGVTAIGNEVALETVSPQQLASSTQPTAVEKAQSKDAGLVFLVILLIVAVIGGIWWFVASRRAKREEEERLARYAKQRREREEQAERDAAAARIRAAAQPPKAVPPAPRPKPAAPVGRTTTSSRNYAPAPAPRPKPAPAPAPSRRRDDDDYYTRSSTWSTPTPTPSSSDWGSSSSTSSDSYDSGGSSGGGGGGSDW